MHLLLTDILTCPVCGPEHGLILLAHQMDQRRIREGALGCPSCRRQYPIHQGIAYVLAEPERALSRPSADAGPPDNDEALRMAALLGLDVNRHGFTLVMGPAARHAAALAAFSDNTEIVAETPPAAGNAPGVSRIAVRSVLPFCAARMHGVWLSGDSADTLLEEGARILHPLGRLVLEGAPANAVERLTARGMRVMLQEQDTMLALHS